MTGSAFQKIVRLAEHLVAQPQYILPYLKSNVFRKTSPVDLELPWFAYGAIDFLKTYLRPNMSVFEYGSGGSTLFFARRCASVICTEDDRGWMEGIRQQLAKKNMHNIVQQYREIDLQSVWRFENSTYLNSIPHRKFDVIVVDGTDNVMVEATNSGVQVRPSCFYHAEKFVTNNGIIILDDSWAYPQVRNKSNAKRVRTFQSVGPCRFGVTSTDVFFY